MEKTNIEKAQEVASYYIPKNRTHIIISPILSSRNKECLLPAVFDCSGTNKEPILIIHRGSIYPYTCSNRFFVTNPFPQILPTFSHEAKEKFLNDLKNFIDDTRANETLRFYFLQYKNAISSSYNFKPLAYEFLEFLVSHGIEANNKCSVKIMSYPRKLEIKFGSKSLTFSSTQ